MKKMTAAESLRTSPWYIFPSGVQFNIDGEGALSLKLDKDNAVKLAFALLQPAEYAPAMEGVSVRLCKKEGGEDG